MSSKQVEIVDIFLENILMIFSSFYQPAMQCNGQIVKLTNFKYFPCSEREFS